MKIRPVEFIQRPQPIKKEFDLDKQKESKDQANNNQQSKPKEANYAFYDKNAKLKSTEKSSFDQKI